MTVDQSWYLGLFPGFGISQYQCITAGTMDLKLNGGDSEITLMTLTNQAPGASGDRQCYLTEYRHSARQACDVVQYGQ
jgi:hypothetical protein